jgi:subfamily B ATP-binding cassette protein MsbA
MLRRSAAHGTSPLAPYLRSLGRFLPLVGALGLLASLLEGAGIGLFIPLTALLLSNSGRSGVPPLIGAIAEQFNSYDPQARVAILAGAIFALILLKGVVQAANDSLAAYVEGRIGSGIRHAVASKLLELDYPFFLRTDSARLIRCWR